MRIDGPRLWCDVGTHYVGGPRRLPVVLGMSCRRRLCLAGLRLLNRACSSGRRIPARLDYTCMCVSVLRLSIVFPCVLHRELGVVAQGLSGSQTQC